MKKTTVKKRPAVARTGVGEVRLIGGQWKRTRLRVPDLPGLRPTPDRVRETLFNWLGQDLSGWHCVDAFAGTGALGFESASRGASQVLLCEQHAALVVQLQNTRQQLQADAVVVRRCDGALALEQLARAGTDLILLDPPFEAPVVERVLRASALALKPTGYVYLEAPVAWSDEQLAPLGLQRHRYMKAGAVHAHLLRRVDRQTA